METKEDKELLLKDLCARLSYGVKCKVKYIINNETTFGEDVEKECIDIVKKINFDSYTVYTEWLGYESDIEDIKPYLRSMSSMTEEEYDDMFHQFYLAQEEFFRNCINGDTIRKIIGNDAVIYDWLLKNHFDFRGLIPSGLAIEVTEDNNPYK